MDSDKIVIPHNFKTNNDETETDNNNSDNEDIEYDDNHVKIRIDPKKDIKGQDNERNRFVINDNENNPWNYRIVLFLQKLGKKTMGYRWMHDQECQNNENEESKYLITEVALTALIDILTGSTLIGLISSIGQETNITLLICLTVATLIIQLVQAVIKGIRETSNFQENASKHNYAATKFSEVNLDIQNQLSLNIKDRDTDKDFIKNIISKFNDLTLIVPKVSQEVKNKYIEASEENDVYNTMLVGDYGNIQIIEKNKKVNEKENEEPEENDDNINSIKTNTSKSQYEINRWLSHF